MVTMHMATMRQHCKMDKAITQPTDSHEITIVDVLVLFTTVDTLYIKEWHRMQSIHLMKWHKILLYVEAECNTAATANWFADRYPQQQHPNHRTSLSGMLSVRNMQPNMINVGRPWCCRSTNVEDVPNAVECQVAGPSSPYFPKNGSEGAVWSPVVYIPHRACSKPCNQC
jgi:hypothetical protein